MSSYIPNPFSHREGKEHKSGMLPQTEATPDIVYPLDPLSQRVAQIIYLCLTFLDKPLQRMVKERSAAIIGAISPLAGGRQMEINWQCYRPFVLPANQQVMELGMVPEIDARFIGHCYAPVFNAAGRITKKGLLSVYGFSAEQDLKRAITFHVECGTTHHLPSDLANTTAFRDRDVLQRTKGILTDIFQREAYSPYTNVPRVLGHEIGHLLATHSPLKMMRSFEREVSRHVKKSDTDFGYYAKPAEAHAEIIGTVLTERFMEHIREQEGLAVTFERRGLQERLPRGYRTYKAIITEMCQSLG